MSKLMSLNIDVTKLNKERLHKGKKGIYAKITVIINDEPDRFGNDSWAWEEQTQDERSAKKDKNYLGNGKVFWDSEQGSNFDKYDNRKKEEEFINDDDLPF